MEKKNEDVELAKKATYAGTAGVENGGSRIPPISGSKKRTPTMAQVVIVSPGEGEGKLDAEQLKTKVMSLIDPCKDKIRIKGVRKRGDGKISIETATEDDLRKIVENEKMKMEGLVVSRNGALNPKVVIYDVPRQMEQEKLAGIVRVQNESLLGKLDKKVPVEKIIEEFAKEFIPRFRIGAKEGPLTNWVVEVSPRVRNILRRSDEIRLYLKWQSCKVYDYRGVTRCYNCQIYGHVAKYCIQKEKTCSFCSIIGHTVAECQSKKEGKNPTCAACKKAKRKSDHSVNDKSCPAYKAALDRVIKRTDYGNNG